MQMSSVGNNVGYLTLPGRQVGVSAPKPSVPTVGGDADGDNDGSKVGVVDVRA